MILRDDDREVIVRNRLDVYHTQTEPLIHYYQEWAQRDPKAPAFHSVLGEGDVDVIFGRVLSAIGV